MAESPQPSGKGTLPRGTLYAWRLISDFTVRWKRLRKERKRARCDMKMHVTHRACTHKVMQVRREDEEKDLLVSCRIFLCLYWLDFVLSTGSGRPHCCDEDLVSVERMASMLRFAAVSCSALISVSRLTPPFPP